MTLRGRVTLTLLRQVSPPGAHTAQINMFHEKILLKYREGDGSRGDQAYTYTVLMILFMQASKSGHVNVLETLITKVKDLQLRTGISVANFLNSESNSEHPIHCAAAAGKLHVIKFLLDQGAFVNARAPMSGTLFTKKILNSSKTIMELCRAKNTPLTCGQI